MKGGKLSGCWENARREAPILVIVVVSLRQVIQSHGSFVDRSPSAQLAPLTLTTAFAAAVGWQRSKIKNGNDDGYGSSCYRRRDGCIISCGMRCDFPTAYLSYAGTSAKRKKQ